MLDADDVVGRRPLRPESLVQPVQRRRHRAVLLAQPLDELHREGGRQRRPLEAREAPGGRRHGPVVADAEQLVGQGVGFLAHRAPAHDALRQAPKVLHQHDAQRDGDRPQLADRQRLDALVGVHEPAEHLGIEAAVGVRDEGPGDAVDTRIAGQGPLGQLGQLPIEPGGRSSRISRSCSSTTWKLSTSHSAAGTIARSSRMALAITRYDSRRTRPLSSTRGSNRRPRLDRVMTGWAAARLSACCSRRSTPKSSARMGFSMTGGALSMLTPTWWLPG